MDAEELTWVKYKDPGVCIGMCRTLSFVKHLCHHHVTAEASATLHTHSSHYGPYCDLTEQFYYYNARCKKSVWTVPEGDANIVSGDPTASPSEADPEDWVKIDQYAASSAEQVWVNFG